MLTEEQLRLEKLYLGLRTRDGISTTDVPTAPNPENVLSSLEHAGLIKVSPDRIYPTLHGFLVADRLPLMFPDP